MFPTAYTFSALTKSLTVSVRNAQMSRGFFAADERV